MTAELGIEKIRVYSSSLALDLHTLCTARGMDADKVVSDLMLEQRCLNPPWEDAVTMAVNAAEPMLDDADRASIGLLLVGTESSVDQEKSASSWVHDFLRLPSDCMNLEVKSACFAATGALQLALAWLESPASLGRKALLISTDQTTMHLGKPWEPVGGASAAAMLLSREPKVIAYERDQLGTHAEEVSDVIRPTPRVETGNSETSLFSYLVGVEGAYRDFVAKVGPVDFETYFDRVVYHVPFSGITFRAHKTLLREFTSVPASRARESFDRMTAPALGYNKRMGTSYGASTFIALTGLIDSDTSLAPGARLGLFAYGSGSCAQFYTARVLPGAREVTQRSSVLAQLDARRMVTVPEYERLEHERNDSIGVPEYEPTRDIVPGHYEKAYQGQRKLVLRRISEYYRTYEWS
jgi:hydroxymethylglutaryl-CoA synthase